MTKIKNTVCILNNYATNALEECLKHYGEQGYTLVSTEIAKNKYDIEVMYLFFTKEE